MCRAGVIAAWLLMDLAPMGPISRWLGGWVSTAAATGSGVLERNYPDLGHVEAIGNG
jgi:hypothetical protein